MNLRRNTLLFSLGLGMMLNRWGCAEIPGAHRVHITIIRRESSVHSSIENRDAYVVRIVPKRGGSFVARIVDDYPGYLDAPRLDFVKKDAIFSVALRRATYCDGSASDSSPDEPIRCFEAVHGSWRMPKAAEEQWWK